MHHFTHAYLPAVLPRENRITNHLFSRAVGAIRTSRKRRAAIRELRQVNEHMLRDIGMSRSQIPTVVDGLLGRSTRPL
jgi:uncharacterized protein YjiS (DUF1127 family)